MAYEKQYSDAVRASVETVYGAGFLSPGGAAEVGHILDGLAIAGRDVLDLGCGPGGAAVALAGDLGAGRVLGIDVDAQTLERAAETVAAVGLADRITLKLVEPGPLPLPDGSFDVVFSKDVIAHVTDKDTLYGEILRVLRPGGAFAGSDWMRGGATSNRSSGRTARRCSISSAKRASRVLRSAPARASPRSTAATCCTATCGRAVPHNAGRIFNGDGPMSKPAGSAR